MTAAPSFSPINSNIPNSDMGEEDFLSPGGGQRIHRIKSVVKGSLRRLASLEGELDSDKKAPRRANTTAGLLARSQSLREVGIQCRMISEKEGRGFRSIGTQVSPQKELKSRASKDSKRLSLQYLHLFPSKKGEDEIEPVRQAITPVVSLSARCFVEQEEPNSVGIVPSIGEMGNSISRFVEHPMEEERSHSFTQVHISDPSIVDVDTNDRINWERTAKKLTVYIFTGMGGALIFYDSFVRASKHIDFPDGLAASGGVMSFGGAFLMNYNYDEEEKLKCWERLSVGRRVKNSISALGLRVVPERLIYASIDVYTSPQDPAHSDENIEKAKMYTSIAISALVTLWSISKAVPFGKLMQPCPKRRNSNKVSSFSSEEV